MQTTQLKSDTMPVRVFTTYRYNDMLAYVSATTFVSMAVIFMLIISL